MGNNYLVQLKNGTLIAVDLNMNYDEGMGDIEEIFSAMNSGQRSMVFYQSGAEVKIDNRHPLLIALPEIVAITPILQKTFEQENKQQTEGICSYRQSAAQ